MICGIISLIYGQFEFEKNMVLSGSFMGGHLAQLSLLIFLFGLLGIYTVIKNDRTALIVYCSISLSSLFIRNFTDGLAKLHGYEPDLIRGKVFGGLYQFFELFSVTLSCILLIKEKFYEISG